VNVSLDSLHRERFERLTRRDELEAVLAGIEAAAAAGFAPVKINVVMMKDVNGRGARSRMTRAPLPRAASNTCPGRAGSGERKTS
jgi:molybdenum cofactor biosynthesis enzyme MoaA